MGRPSLKIVKDEYQTEVNKLETSQQFTKRSDVFAALAESQWAKNIRDSNGGLIGAKASTLYLYSKKLGIQFKTEPGKRGAVTGENRFGENRGKKVKKTFTYPESTYREFPEEFHYVLKKAEQGSRRHAIEARCLECSNFQRAEIRHCVIKDCTLYPFRPNKVKVNPVPDLVQIG